MGSFSLQNTPIIELIEVSKTFNEKETSRGISNVSFAIEHGESFVLIGSSGSGKTTLLKVLNGLVEPTCGTVLIKGKNIKTYNMNTLRRSFFGYVFQRIGLFPHMTIKENIEIILRLNKSDLECRQKRVIELLECIRLNPSRYLNRYPDQLSGGEQQRVGVARALAANSECLLMDEPFGALDAVTRCELQDEILRLKKDLKKTIIFVTHDIFEAFKIGDRLAVMQEGKIEQIGTKEQLSQFPQTPFVKQLVCSGLKS